MKKISLKKEIKTAGIILALLGIIHIIFSSYLSIGWGIILLIGGGIAFFYQKIWMLLAFGIGLILVGLLNIESSFSTGIGFWPIFGIFQIYWGITEIVRYSKIKKLEKRCPKLSGGQKFLIVLGIIILSIFVLFLVSFFEGLFYLRDSSSLFDESQQQIEFFGGDYRYEEERIEEMLTEDGYEVLLVTISNYSADATFFDWYGIEDNTVCEDSEEFCHSDKVGVSVDMKSLGNRNDQVWDVLITMYIVYPNAFTYRIEIKSPIDTCYYIIFGDLARSWFEDNNMDSYGLIDDYIGEATCS